MAFHTACPITSRKICYCELGFRGDLNEKRKRDDFLENVIRVQDFLDDPWVLRDGVAVAATVDVAVPRVVRLLEEAVESPERMERAERVREEEYGEVVPVAVPVAPAMVSRAPTQWALSLKEKRNAMREEAAATSRAAEEYAKRLEAGMAADVPGDIPESAVAYGHGSSMVKVICRICFSGENEGSEKAIKMLSCKKCDKKYHRNCLKTWAEYRDLFHWDSWTCPSCRVCEVCQSAGDPTKLMYCKRCDDAYHCYCQMPPHKNFTHGPYLCPKHTRCHSCSSTVCGSGHSTRWFLSYTCCDACGRLFVKGNYCPICLKVYRDSEMTPMVCCDVCQKWVHCYCDGISDEKYQQFGKNGNLSYKCAACRGECYKVKDLEDAVRELWRRKDKADSHLTACLRSAAGLPREINTIFPFPDEERGPVLIKNDHRLSLKISGKGFSDNNPKSSKEYQKNFRNSLPNTKYGQKGNQVKSRGDSEPYRGEQHEPATNESIFKDKISAHNKSSKSDWQGNILPSNFRSPEGDRDEQEPITTLKQCSVNSTNSVSKFHIKGTKRSLHLKEGDSNNLGKNEAARGTKLVILMGAKSGNTTSTRFEASSCQREQEYANGNDKAKTIRLKEHGADSKLETPSVIEDLVDVEGARLDNASWMRSERAQGETNVSNSEKIFGLHRKGTGSEEHKQSVTYVRRKRNPENEVLPSKQTVGPPIDAKSQQHHSSEPLSSNSSDDPKPLLKLKFKKPYFEQRSSLAPQKVEEMKSVKGKRSKRKRPSLEKLLAIQGKASSQLPTNESGDGKIILRKPGKKAIR